MDMNDRIREALVPVLKHEIVKQRANISEFIEKLNGDYPGNAMSWADSMFRCTAMVEIYQKAIDALTGPDSKATAETVMKYANTEVFRTVRNSGSRSTSECSNQMQLAYGYAWHEVMEHIKDIRTSLEWEDGAEAREASKVECPRCKVKVLPQNLDNHTRATPTGRTKACTAK